MQNKNISNFISFSFFLIAAILLSGCGGFSAFPGSSPDSGGSSNAQTQFSPLEYFQEGIRNFNHFKYQQAIQNFGKALEADPGHHGALFYRGRCFIKMNNLNQALQDFNKILHLYSRSSKGLAGRAEVMIERKNYIAAMHEVEKAIASDRNMAYAWYLKGLIYGYQNKLDQAISAFKTCLDKDRKYAYAHYQLGLAYNQKNKPELAVTHLEVFLELAPNAPEAGQVRDLLNSIRHP